MMDTTIDSKLEQVLRPIQLDEGGFAPPISRDLFEPTKKYISSLQELLKSKGLDIGEPGRIMNDSEGGIDVEWNKKDEYSGVLSISHEGACYCIISDNKNQNYGQVIFDGNLELIK